MGDQKVEKSQTIVKFFLNNLDLLKNFESELSDSEENQENLIQEFRTYSTSNKVENSHGFGVNPILIYQNLIHSFEFEMSKLKGFKNEDSTFYLNQFFLCEKVFNKIHALSFHHDLMPKFKKPNDMNDLNLNEKIKLKFSTKKIELIENKLIKGLTIVKKVKNTKFEKKKNFRCEVCKDFFYNGQALGGHMSRTHPRTSEKYNKKKQIRNNRTVFRTALKDAKTELLLRYNLSYKKLMVNKESKNKIKSMLELNKLEYKSILTDIRSKIKNLKPLNVISEEKV